MRRNAILAGVALSSGVLGHLAAFVLTYPRGSIRGNRLAATGHGSFDWILLAALVSIPLVLFLVARLAMRESEGFGVRETARRLAAIQVSAFLLLELLERQLSIAHTVADPAVLIGLMVQVLLASLAAALLAGLVGGLRAVVTRLRPHGRVPMFTRPVRPALRIRAASLVFLIASRRRAPPVPLTA